MMKRILAVVAMLPAVAFAAPAAENLRAGAFELRGDSSIGFASGSNKLELTQGGATQSTTTDTTTWSLGASGLYYLNPNVGVGGRLSYLSEEQKTGGTTEKTSALFIGPAVGVDFPVAEKLSVFAQGAVGYMTAKQTIPLAGAGDVSGSGFGFNLAAGVKYFFTRNFSFDAGLGYDWAKITFDKVEGVEPKLTMSQFGVNLGLSVYLQ